MLTPFQKNNLLQFLNRVELKGIDEANAFMEVINIIQNSEENHPTKEVNQPESNITEKE